jgi:Golgi SNAP receptor complex protein 1
VRLGQLYSWCRSSDRLVNEQIAIAMETREHLTNQRQTFKRLQTRFNDLSNRYPVINSLIQRINLKKRRDSIILGLVVSACTILVLLYIFR